MRIGLINGSARHASNTAGLVDYIGALVASHRSDIQLDVIHLTNSPGHPLPLVIEDQIPAAHPPESLPESYAHPDVRQWSSTVKTWSAMLIVTPQYNWGYPGLLKNALDHLFLEWRDMPMGVITIGGHGGGKCAAQLRQVLEGGCKMQPVTQEIAISLPKDTIGGTRRLQSDDAVFQERAADILALFDELAAMAKPKKSS